MTKKKDDSLTKREALILAWKSRENYKGYDRSAGSAFNSWRAIIRTEKGKKIGFPESWKDFDIFTSEVQGTWEKGKVVCRFDIKKPHSKENSFWSEKGSENSSKLIVFEYNGVSKTLIEWAKELNLNYQGIRQRYFKGKNHTKQEILFGKQKRQRTEQERSHQIKTLRMLGAYKLRDKKKGVESNVDIHSFREIITKGCIYCGDFENVGLDRINNSKGHTMDNVVPCCYVCNCARMDNFSVDEMKEIGAVIKKIKEARRANRKK